MVPTARRQHKMTIATITPMTIPSVFFSPLKERKKHINIKYQIFLDEKYKSMYSKKYHMTKSFKFENKDVFTLK